MSIMVYGSEAWRLTTDVTRTINGANSEMVAVMTGKTIREDATEDTRTCDAVVGIRATRLK